MQQAKFFKPSLMSYRNIILLIEQELKENNLFSFTEQKLKNIQSVCANCSDPHVKRLLLCVLAKQHKADILYALAMIYVHGAENIIGQDFKSAHNYFTQVIVCNKNHKEGWYHLGIMYMNGEGCHKDIEKAKQCLEESSNLEYGDAAFALGDMWQYGTEITKRDNNKAFIYYMLASKYGNTDAMVKIAVDYFIPKQKFIKAKNLFKIAHRLGNTDATLNLGRIYLNGYVGDKNRSKGIEVLKTIEDQSVEACSILANVYLTGKVVNKDLNKVKEYYEKASALGDGHAAYHLYLLYLQSLQVSNHNQLSPEQNDHAMQLLNKAVVLGDPAAIEMAHRLELSSNNDSDTTESLDLEDTKDGFRP